MDFDHILPPLSQCFASHTTFFVETKKKIVVSFFSIRHRSLSKPRNKKHVRRRSKSADRVADDTGSSEDGSDREEKVSFVLVHWKSGVGARPIFFNSL